MKFTFAASLLALASFVAASPVAGETECTACESKMTTTTPACKPVTTTVYKTVLVTSMVTKTESVSYCPTPTPSPTTCQGCPTCPVVTITTTSQPVCVSIVTTTKKSSVYCPTPATYTCGPVTTYVSVCPTYVYADCEYPTYYYCPYEDIAKPTKTYDVYCYDYQNVYINYFEIDITIDIDVTITKTVTTTTKPPMKPTTTTMSVPVSSWKN